MADSSIRTPFISKNESPNSESFGDHLETSGREMTWTHFLQPRLSVVMANYIIKTSVLLFKQYIYVWKALREGRRWWEGNPSDNSHWGPSGILSWKLAPDTLLASRRPSVLDRVVTWNKEERPHWMETLVAQETNLPCGLSFPWFITRGCHRCLAPPRMLACFLAISGKTGGEILITHLSHSL